MMDDWMAELVGKWVLFSPGSRIGKVTKIWQSGEYVSQYNGKPVHSPVVEWEDGSSFVAEEKNFVILTEAEHLAFEIITIGLKDLCARTMQEVANRRVSMPAGVVLLQAALQSQIQALKAPIPVPPLPPTAHSDISDP